MSLFTSFLACRINRNSGAPETSEVNIYLLAAVIANLFCLLSFGYDGDIGYWREWMRQLQNEGYSGFEGNYPPVYVHWLWVCAKFAELLGLTLDGHVEVKTLAVIPVVISHLILVRVAYPIAKSSDFPSAIRKFVMWLTALNPVFLADGPMWGQVDLFPVTLVIFGLLAASSSSRCSILAVPLYCLALLTKFQMIAFAPVFGFVFFRNLKFSLVGLLLALCVVFMVLLPFIIANNLIDTLENAYIKTLGQYPLATMYAANLWMALYGNMWPDTQPVFEFLFDDSAAEIVTIKSLGILLYGILAVAVFLRGCRLLVRDRKGGNSKALDFFIWEATLLCAFGFFILLPGMHERYLFPASVVAIFYVLKASGSLSLAVLITLCAFLNIVIVLPLRGDDLWRPLAIFSTVVFLSFLMSSWVPGLANKIRTIGVSAIGVSRFIPETVLACALIFLLGFEKWFVWVDETVDFNEVRLIDVAPASVTQDWGKLMLNRTVAGRVFEVSFRKFRYGLGTHANSEVIYSLDKNFQMFRFRAGINEESVSGFMQFKVYGDAQLIWQSRRMRGGDLTDEVVLNIEGVEKLSLVVESLGSVDSDHANWLNPVLLKAE